MAVAIIAKMVSLRAAHSFSLLMGGFVFTYHGEFFHVPAVCSQQARESGMEFVMTDENYRILENLS